MNKNVIVVNKKTGHVVTEIRVVINLYGQEPEEEDFVKEAWRSAVDDGAVKDEDFENYSFQFETL
jgi:hypothetical protein